MRILACLFLVGCAASSGGADDTSASAAPACSYPDGAVEPMALGEVLTPYLWPDARSRRDDRQVALDLHDVPCDTSPDIDWGSHDVLLFVSLPAW